MANRQTTVTYVCNQSAAADTIIAYGQPTTCNYTLTVASARFCNSGFDCPEWRGAPAPPVAAAVAPAYCAPAGVVQPVSQLSLPNVDSIPSCAAGTLVSGRCRWVTGSVWGVPTYSYATPTYALVNSCPTGTIMNPAQTG